MKYLIVLVVVFLGVWLWRKNRLSELAEKQTQFEQEASRQRAKKTMVACAHCGIHLPQIEALAAPSADLRSQLWFCSTEHRQFGVKNT
jgi:uncharacterized protein